MILHVCGVDYNPEQRSIPNILLQRSNDIENPNIILIFSQKNLWIQYNKFLLVAVLIFMIILIFQRCANKNKILSSLISILATILTILYKLILLFSVKVIIKLNDGLDLFSNLTYLLLEWHKQSKNMTIFKGTFKI